MVKDELRWGVFGKISKGGGDGTGEAVTGEIEAEERREIDEIRRDGAGKEVEGEIDDGERGDLGQERGNGAGEGVPG